MLLPSAAVGNLTLSKGLQKREGKNLGFTLPFKNWIFHPPGWGEFLFSRGECCCSCRRHKLTASPFPAKANRQRGIHLVMFWSASCMYWHIFLYITDGTSCHKISSLNLFWRFSHSIKLFLFIWNSKVHDLGKKKIIQSHLKRADLISGFISQAGSLLQKISSWLICIINHLNKSGPHNFKEQTMPLDC